MEGQERNVYRGFRDLKVCQLSHKLTLQVFEAAKIFPKEEKYSLVDQIKSSSRSVCSNLDEASRKGKHKAVFANKVTDAMQEASETQNRLEFAGARKYISQELFEGPDDEYEDLIAMLNSMERNVDKFCF